MSKKLIWTNADKARLKMVINRYPNFIDLDDQDLFKKLDTDYKNKGTLSVICFTLKKIFAMENDNDKADYFLKKANEMDAINRDIENKNELTNAEREKWLTQDQLLNIMNNIKILNRTDYNRYLILLMTTLQPTLRKYNYQSMKFIFNTKYNNRKENYLYLSKTPKKAYYIINDDKVSKHSTYGDESHSVIEIEDNRLVNYLWDSYNKNKRKYVFEKEGGGPYTLGSFSKVLLEQPFNLNFNILRSSYITNYFKNPNNNYMKARIDLARKMRHSVDKQMTNYEKRMIDGVVVKAKD